MKEKAMKSRGKGMLLSDISCSHLILTAVSITSNF